MKQVFPRLYIPTGAVKRQGDFRSTEESVRRVQKTPRRTVSNKLRQFTRRCARVRRQISHVAFEHNLSLSTQFRGLDVISRNYRRVCRFHSLPENTKALGTKEPKGVERPLHRGFFPREPRKLLAQIDTLFLVVEDLVTNKLTPFETIDSSLAVTRDGCKTRRGKRSAEKPFSKRT